MCLYLRFEREENTKCHELAIDFSNKKFVTNLWLIHDNSCSSPREAQQHSSVYSPTCTAIPSVANDVFGKTA